MNLNLIKRSRRDDLISWTGDKRLLDEDGYLTSQILCVKQEKGNRISYVCCVEKWMLHKKIMTCDVIRRGQGLWGNGQGLLEENVYVNRIDSVL